MSESSLIDIPSVCQRVIQEIRRDSVRSALKLNATSVEIWRRRLNYVRVDTKTDSFWEQATMLLAKLKLAQEGLLVVGESDIGEEIENFLSSSSSSFVEPKRIDEHFSSEDELVNACLSAEKHLSFARELISQFDREPKSDREVVERKLKVSSTDVKELVEEISTHIEKATSVVKDELSKFEGSE